MSPNSHGRGVRPISQPPEQANRQLSWTHALLTERGAWSTSLGGSGVTLAPQALHTLYEVTCHLTHAAATAATRLTELQRTHTQLTGLAHQRERDLVRVTQEAVHWRAEAQTAASAAGLQQSLYLQEREIAHWKGEVSRLLATVAGLQALADEERRLSSASSSSTLVGTRTTTFTASLQARLPPPPPTPLHAITAAPSSASAATTAATMTTSTTHPDMERREQHVRDRETLAEERLAHLTEQEAALTQRTADRDAALLRRETTVTEQEASLRERETTLRAKEEAAAAADRTATERLAAADTRLTERETRLREQEHHVQVRETDVAHRDRDLATKHKEVAAKMGELMTKEQLHTAARTEWDGQRRVLQDQVKQWHGEAQRQANDNAELRKEVVRLAPHAQSANAEVHRLTGLLQARDHDLAAAATRHTDLAAQLHSRDTQLAEAEKRLAKVVADLETSTAELKELATVKIALDTLEKEKTRLEGDVSASREQQQSLQKRVQELEAELEQRAPAHDAEAVLAELRDAVEKATRRAEEAEAAQDKDNRTSMVCLQSYITRFKDMEAQLAELTAHTGLEPALRDELTRRALPIPDSVAEMLSALAPPAKEDVRHQEQMRDLQARLTAMTEQLDTARQWQDRAEKLEHTARTQAKDVQEARAALDAARAHIAQLTADLSTPRTPAADATDLDETRRRTEQLQAELDELRRNPSQPRSGSPSRADELAAELDTTTKEAEELKLLILRKDLILADRDSKLTKLQQELARSRETADALDQTRRELNDRDAQVEGATQRALAAEQACARFTEEVEALKASSSAAAEAQSSMVCLSSLPFPSFYERLTH